eukprot:COSAG06_NODE_21176_length_767_cov_0.745509_1_plen_69_part_10
MEIVGANLQNGLAGVGVRRHLVRWAGYAAGGGNFALASPRVRDYHGRAALELRQHCCPRAVTSLRHRCR